MTEPLGPWIDAAIRREAESLAGPSFTAEVIVRAGRSAVRRRRRTALGAGAAALVLVAGGAYALPSPEGPARPPVTQPPSLAAPEPQPDPSSQFRAAADCAPFEPGVLPSGADAGGSRPFPDGPVPSALAWGQGADRVVVAWGRELFDPASNEADHFPRPVADVPLQIVTRNLVPRVVVPVGDPPLGEIVVQFVIGHCPYRLWISEGHTRKEALDYAGRLTIMRTTTSELGVAAYAGNVVVLPDERRVDLPWPADQVFSVHQLPDGLVVETVDGLWLVPPEREPSLIGRLATPVFSPDGRTLVAGTLGPSPTVVAVALPSLEERGRTTFEVGTGPQAVGITGDRVLLRGAQGGPGPSPAAVWDLSTGTLGPVVDNVWVWGMSDDGLVLRRVDQPGDQPKAVVSACVDVVPLAVTLPVSQEGLCGEEAKVLNGGAVSPDGRWVFLTAGGPAATDPAAPAGPLLVATDDLRAGRWRPVMPTRVGGEPVVWDTVETFLARDANFEDGYVRCHVSGRCRPVALPAGLGPDASVVPRYGG